MTATTPTKKQETTTGLPLAEWMERYTRQPIEVVNGEIVTMSPPTRQHVRIARDLYDLIRDYLKQHPLGEVWPDNTPYVLDGNERKDWVRDSRVPDVSFISRERIKAHEEKYGAEEGPWRLAPDLAVEVVSTNDRYSDVMQKVADYLRYGTRLVWVIDPQNRTVRVHTPDDPDGHTLHEADTLPGDPVLPGWQIAVRVVLDGPEAQQAE